MSSSHLNIIHLFSWCKKGVELSSEKQTLHVVLESSSPFSMSGFKEEWDCVLCCEKWLGVQNDSALITPQPPDPSRQNTSTYLQERRDKKINDCTLNYIPTYQASAPFVSSGGDGTPLYRHNVCKSLLRFPIRSLISYLFTKIIFRIEVGILRLESESHLYPPDLQYVHLSSPNKRALPLLYYKGQASAERLLQSRCHKTRYEWLFIKCRMMTI